MLVTSEKLIYAWGENSWGQLGVGDRVPRAHPCLVECMTGKTITKLAIGRGFSVFCSDNGILMTCGRAQCNGQGIADEDLLRPRLIDSLLTSHIHIYHSNIKEKVSF